MFEARNETEIKQRRWNCASFVSVLLQFYYRATLS